MSEKTTDMTITVLNQTKEILCNTRKRTELSGGESIWS